MRLHLLVCTFLSVAVGTTMGCNKNAEPAEGGATVTAAAEDNGPITVYCGRSKSLVKGIFDDFTKATGIEVKARWGKTTATANTLLEEGANSPADLFFAQDAGALGALAAKGLLKKLPASVLDKVDAGFRDPAGQWVGISGRARVVTYNTDKLKPADLPDSLEGFTAKKWKGRIGWPPTNASFQSFITGMRVAKSDAYTEFWLKGILDNEPRVYPKNTPAVQGVAKGEVDVAFVNHYYLHRLKKEAGDKPFPAANYHPRGGGPGAMVNVAGAGILKTSKHSAAAEKLLTYLLSKPAQERFATDNFEYPLAEGIAPPEGLPALKTLKLPKLELGKLSDLESTLKLLRKATVLK